MHKSATITWVILIVLTIASAFISKVESSYIVSAILFLSALKFIGIAFQFMEIKKAHPFWKGLIIGFIIIFSTAIVVII